MAGSAFREIAPGCPGVLPGPRVQEEIQSQYQEDGLLDGFSQGDLGTVWPALTDATDQKNAHTGCHHNGYDDSEKRT